MEQERQWLMFFGMTSLIVGIVLFSVVFGGYSSLYRSENRIKASKELLTDACQTRLDVFSQIIKSLDTQEHQTLLLKLKQTNKEAILILKQVIKQTSPLDNALTLKFENSQKTLTSDLVKLYLLLNKAKGKNDQDAKALIIIKKEFFPAQDILFVSVARYNKEVVYFNYRVTIFPVYLIAKLFGFDKSQYFKLTQEFFLPAKETFINPKA